MLTVTPSSVARAFMPSCTRLRNVSLLGNATPIVTLPSVTGSGAAIVGAADAGASDPGAIDVAGDMGASDGLWAIATLETPRNIPATTVRVVNRQAAIRTRIELLLLRSRGGRPSSRRPLGRPTPWSTTTATVGR